MKKRKFLSLLGITTMVGSAVIASVAQQCSDNINLSRREILNSAMNQINTYNSAVENNLSRSSVALVNSFNSFGRQIFKNSDVTLETVSFSTSQIEIDAIGSSVIVLDRNAIFSFSNGISFTPNTEATNTGLSEGFQLTNITFTPGNDIENALVNNLSSPPELDLLNNVLFNNPFSSARTYNVQNFIKIFNDGIGASTTQQTGITTSNPDFFGSDPNSFNYSFSIRDLANSETSVNAYDFSLVVVSLNGNILNAGEQSFVSQEDYLFRIDFENYLTDESIESNSKYAVSSSDFSIDSSTFVQSATSTFFSLSRSNSETEQNVIRLIQRDTAGLFFTITDPSTNSPNNAAFADEDVESITSDIAIEQIRTQAISTSDDNFNIFLVIDNLRFFYNSPPSISPSVNTFVSSDRIGPYAETPQNAEVGTPIILSFSLSARDDIDLPGDGEVFGNVFINAEPSPN